jgi:RNA polymerase sigma factor (sigma-70 family)
VEWPDIVSIGLDLAQTIARAQQGDTEAFDALYAAHAGPIAGFIRPRVARDEDAQDVAQQTWLQVWTRLASYDPARASFYTFARYWASVMLLRHYDERSRRGVEIIISDLTLKYPNLVAEEGLAAIIERLAPTAVGPLEHPAVADVHTQLLRRSFDGSSPPHQVIAFGFSRVSGWTPREIARDRSNVPLRDLARELVGLYTSESGLPAELLQRVFTPFLMGLDRPFEVVVSDPKTRATYPHLHGQIVGHTDLEDYYTGPDRADQITRWWYAVQRRVRKAVMRRASGPTFEASQAAVERARSASESATSSSAGHGDG